MAAIYLIRHGQASFGKQDYDALSPLGEEQSRTLGRTLAERIGAPDRVVCGGMQRHRQTASHVLSAMNAALEWEDDPRWNEYDHEMLITRHEPEYADPARMMADLARAPDPRVAFRDLFESALGRWVSRAHDAEYTEPWPAFQSRVGHALEALTQAPPKVTFVFSSGGAIGAAVQQLWRVPDDTWMKLNGVIANASITKVVVGRSGVQLSTFNDHGHFEGERRLLTYR